MRLLSCLAWVLLCETGLGQPVESSESISDENWLYDVSEEVEEEGDDSLLRAEEGEPYYARMAAIISRVDANKDGMIDVDEVAAWMETADAARKEHLGQKELSRIDSDHDGGISWDEWKAVGLQYQGGLVPRDPAEQEKLLRLRFDLADTDKDSIVGPLEVSRLLSEDSHADEQLMLFARGMTAEHDSDKDGLVTFEEFISTAHPDAFAALPNELNDGEADSGFSGLTKKQVEYLRQDFDAADSNKDGALTAEEIAAVLREETADLRSDAENDEQNDVQNFVDDVMSVMGEATGRLAALESVNDPEAEDAHIRAARALKVPVEETKKVWTLLANSPFTANGALLTDPGSLHGFGDIAEVSSDAAGAAAASEAAAGVLQRDEL